MAISFTLLDQAIDNLITHLAPPGEVRFFMRDTVPPGWLLWQNTKIYQNQYPRLYDVMKNLPRLTKGSDSGGAYVILPNIDNRVLQATTSVSNVGQLLEASLPNITGAWSNMISSHAEAVAIGACSFGTITNKCSSTADQAPAHLSFNAASSNALYAGGALQVPASLCLVAIRF